MSINHSKYLGEGLLRHDGVEIIDRNLTIPTGIGALDHLSQLFFGHGFSELFSDSLQILQRDGAGLVVIKEGENLADALAGLLVTQLVCDAGEEIFEIDSFTGKAGDHAENGRVLRLESERLHGGLELLGVDGPTTVRVKQIECFTDFVNLIFGKAGALPRFHRTHSHVVWIQLLFFTTTFNGALMIAV